MEFGNHLKALREKRGLSQGELARRSGVSWSYISFLEAGKRKSPSVKIILALAGALAVSVEELLGQDSREPLQMSMDMAEFAKLPPELREFLLKDILPIIERMAKKLSDRERKARVKPRGKVRHE